VSEISTVQVHLSERSYSIQIGSGNLHQVGPTVAALGEFTHAVVITDANVEPLHAKSCAERLAETIDDVDC
jgi:3-dehydroquinate synthetase